MAGPDGFEEQPKPLETGTEQPVSGGTTRRGFLRDAAFAAGGIAAGGGLVGAVLGHGQEQQASKDVIKPDQLTEEQREALQERVWGGLTEVLQEGLFSKDSFSITSITQIAPRKGGLLLREKEARTKIEGSLRGNSRQVGVHFSIDYGKEPVAPGEELTLNVGDETSGAKQVVLGEQKGQILEMGYFTGENAGDVYNRAADSSYSFATRRIPRDIEGMKKRFEDMTEVLKKHTKIPPETPFIPNDDFNGLHTFANHRTGYGLLVESVEGIDGKSVTFKMTEGLLTNDASWGEFAARTHIAPKDISFRKMLQREVARINDPKHALVDLFEMAQPPAKEYINNLGKQYLPQEMVGEARKGS